MILVDKDNHNIMVVQLNNTNHLMKHVIHHLEIMHHLDNIPMLNLMVVLDMYYPMDNTIFYIHIFYPILLMLVMDQINHIVVVMLIYLVQN